MNVSVRFILFNIISASFLFGSSGSLAQVGHTIPKTDMSRPDDIAVVIGNKKYKNSDIPNVDYAVRDSRVIKKYLTRTLGFRPKNIIYVEDASGVEMRNTFGTSNDPQGKLYNWVKQGKSSVFVYYSGHGAPNPESGNAYLLPSNTNPNFLSQNGYPLKQLYENLAQIPAKSITVVLEACFSGTSEGGAVVQNASPAVLSVENPVMAMEEGLAFTAGSTDQIASWYPKKKHGLFTYYFLKGLHGTADTNDNNAVTVKEMKSYLTEKVTYRARRMFGREQTPQVLGRNKERVLVKYNSKKDLPILPSAEKTSETKNTNKSENENDKTNLNGSIELLRRLANIQLKNDRPKKVLNLYQRAIQQGKTLKSEDYINRAKAYEKMDRLPNARQEYRRAIETSPDFLGDAYLAIAALYEQNGNFSKAREVYREAIETSPDFFGGAHIGIADSYKQDGTLSKARQKYQSIIDRNPDFAQAYVAIGDLYASAVSKCSGNQLKRKDKAVYWAAVDKYQQAIDVDSSIESVVNSKIRSYRDVFPTQEDIFYRNDWEKGQSFTIDYGCYSWIGETTTVRQAP